jgi:Camelysin metallo-endopeptidase
VSAHVTPYRAFRPRRVSVTKKVALTAAAVGVAAAASGGVLAAWSQTSSLISGSYTTGIVTTSFTDTGTNAWTTSVPNLIPGDYVYRYLRIDNTGTVKQDFALTVAGVTNGTDNAWASDPSLRITVTRCAVAWTQATNSCGNSPATVITTRPVSTASGSFPVQTDVAPSGAMYLQVKLELDANAPNSVQGRSGKVQLTETGTQQAGTQR